METQLGGWDFKGVVGALSSPTWDFNLPTLHYSRHSEYSTLIEAGMVCCWGVGQSDISFGEGVTAFL